MVSHLQNHCGVENRKPCKMPRILELCAGTGSIGKAFKDHGWEVVSLDLMPDFSPTIQADLMTWNFEVAYPSGHFDVCWCSPPCTEYSRAKTTGKRDLGKADSLVKRMLDIFQYFQPNIWAFENPFTGLLKTRDVVDGLPFKFLCYCKYGFPYKKATAIWTNLETWQPRPMCTKATPCECIVDGKHPQTAQRGPGKKDGKRVPSEEDKFSMHQLYSMPPTLCKEFAQACNERVHFLEERVS